MTQHDDRETEALTLESLLADPLTQLVMQSDRVTVAETAQVFMQAHLALALRTRLAPPDPAWRAGRLMAI